MNLQNPSDENCPFISLKRGIQYQLHTHWDGYLKKTNQKHNNNNNNKTKSDKCWQGHGETADGSVSDMATESEPHAPGTIRHMEHIPRQPSDSHTAPSGGTCQRVHIVWFPGPHPRLPGPYSPSMRSQSLCRPCRGQPSHSWAGALVCCTAATVKACFSVIMISSTWAERRETVASERPT